MRTEQELIMEAIQVQDACNLSGVVQSFAKAIKELWQLKNAKSAGTSDINRHRLCRLYADKIKQLAGEVKLHDFSTDNLDTWR